MKLKKGDVVEVMNRKEVPVSWLVAEILSGNGHTYMVRYECDPRISSGQMVEKFSRKFIRPRPPLVQGFVCFSVGDVVEVFYDYSWKTATILKGLEGEIGSETMLFLVSFIGCSQQFIVGRSTIRKRQTWCDDKWILMDKSSLGGDDLANKPSVAYAHQKIILKISKFSGRLQNQPLKDCRESQNVKFSNSRSLKRMSPYSSSIVEADNRSKKYRRIEKDGYFNEMEISKQHVFGCSQVRRSEVSRSDSGSSSVGSCSVNSQSLKNYTVFKPLIFRDTDLCSDAESCAGPDSGALFSDAESCGDSDAESCGDEKSSFAPLVEVDLRIHGLELDAYRSTLKALYVSGPLRWEHESLLTNLRDELHISSDEHLIEGQKLEACIIRFQKLKDDAHPFSWQKNLYDTIRGLVSCPGIINHLIYDCFHMFCRRY